MREKRQKPTEKEKELMLTHKTRWEKYMTKSQAGVEYKKFKRVTYKV